MTVTKIIPANARNTVFSLGRGTLRAPSLSSPTQQFFHLEKSSLRGSFTIPELQLSLFGEIASGWTISRLLRITLERDDDGCYLVSDDQFSIYGDGSTPIEALQDYIVSLIDYYQLLAERAVDDQHTQALFDRLRLYLRPVAG